MDHARTHLACGKTEQSSQWMLLQDLHMIRTLTFAALAGTLIAGPALALTPTSPTNEARLAEVAAQVAAIDNRWQDSVTASARAYNRSPSLENEFNLASAYENTGRPTLAIPLYRDVAVHGELTVVRALYDYHRTRGPRLQAFYIADEAVTRLERLTGVTVASSAR